MTSQEIDQAQRQATRDYRNGRITKDQYEAECRRLSALWVARGRALGCY